jgi:alkylhydroperoxidase family enzyme
VLLRGPSTLTTGDRELIATFVSARNDYYFCQTIHGAATAYHLKGNEQVVAEVKGNLEGTSVPPELKALLAIAGKCSRAENEYNRKTSTGRAHRGCDRSGDSRRGPIAARNLHV